MAVPRSGKRHRAAGAPPPSSAATSASACVLFPARSAPSSTMKAPRGGAGGGAMAPGAPLEAGRAGEGREGPGAGWRPAQLRRSAATARGRPSRIKQRVPEGAAAGGA